LTLFEREKMSLTEQELRKVAKLSRIKLDKDQVAHYTCQISEIMSWVDILSEVNTENVPCMASVSDLSMPSREDKETDGNCQLDILANATNSQYGFFTVPKVIE
jgi:aspartyl-tRNA(Asn)/glutamyl-tRNA(Gln) amidotransferase subunit C